MNKDMMKRNLHCHVLLQPPAYRLDHNGLEIKTVVDDDWWLIQDVTDDGVTIFDPRTYHARLLSYDHIQKFTSDVAKDGAKRGFLTLLVQLYVQGNNVRVLPTRPGEPLPPKRPEIVEKVVKSDYPRASGMQQRLEAQGYSLRWARPENVATRIDIDGHEVVIEGDSRGMLATFRTKDGSVLLKRRG